MFKSSHDFSWLDWFPTNRGIYKWWWLFYLKQKLCIGGSETPCNIILLCNQEKPSFFNPVLVYIDTAIDSNQVSLVNKLLSRHILGYKSRPESQRQI